MKTYKLKCSPTEGCIVERGTERIVESCPACATEYELRHTVAMLDRAARTEMPEKRAQS